MVLLQPGSLRSSLSREEKRGQNDYGQNSSYPVSSPQRYEQHVGRQAQRGHGDTEVAENAGHSHSIAKGGAQQKTPAG
jgi:hypothetical protein